MVVVYNSTKHILRKIDFRVKFHFYLFIFFKKLMDQFSLTKIKPKLSIDIFILRQTSICFVITEKLICFKYESV
jgi:hypothetical protein